MFDRGYLKLFTIKGAALRFHWSLPVGLLLFTRAQFRPGLWLGITLLVLIHEVGHALLVRRYGQSLHSIDLTGFGGLCRYGGAPTPFQRSAIAWGGVLAQALLLVVAGIAYGALIATRPELLTLTLVDDVLVQSWVWTNIFLIALNLIPFPPLDGAKAWSVFTHWPSKRKIEPPPNAPLKEPERPQTLSEALRDADRR